MANRKPMKRPNLLPLFRYFYDPRRAGDNTTDVRTCIISSGFGSFVKHIVMNPVYGTFQYKSLDGNCAGVIEGGFLWQYMHDFCGGILVSSAWASLEHTTAPGEDEWGVGHYWRRVLWGTAEGNNSSVCEDIRKRALRASWPTWATVVPSVAPYVENEEMRDSDALRLMQNSVAGAILSTARSLGRGGIFAADRMERAETRAAMERAAALPHSYVSLPTYGHSPHYTTPSGNAPRVGSMGGRESMIHGAWNETLCRNTGMKAGMVPPYINHNSGNQVALQWITVHRYTDPSPVHHTDDTGSAWSLTGPGKECLRSPLIYDLLPQQVFHNA